MTLAQAPEQVLPSELTLHDAFRQGMTFCGGGAYGSYPELAAFNGLAPFQEEGLDVIAEVTRAYLDAGTRAITSYTFGPQHEVLKDKVSSDPEFSWGRIAEGRANAYRVAARVADEFARETGENVLLLAAVRPPADCYRPNLPRDYSKAQREHIVRTALKPLVDAGANNFLFETVPSIRDARVMLEVAKEKELHIDLGNVALSFYVEQGDDGTILLPDGATLAEAVDIAREFGVASIGLNCVSPELALDALPEIAEHWEGWITLHPNGLYSPPTDDSDVHRLAEAAGIDLPTWLDDANAMLTGEQRHRLRILGGCCVTTPHTISALNGQIQRVRSKQQKTVARQRRGQ